MSRSIPLSGVFPSAKSSMFAVQTLSTHDSIELVLSAGGGTCQNESCSMGTWMKAPLRFTPVPGPQPLFVWLFG